MARYRWRGSLLDGARGQYVNAGRPRRRGDGFLPAVCDLKARRMKVGDGTVGAFMKDIQVGASSFPGKAFEMTIDMPEADVGIMTFNKCIQVEQWEALGRPDIAGTFELARLSEVTADVVARYIELPN